MDAYPGVILSLEFPSIRVEKNAHYMGSHSRGALPKYMKPSNPTLNH